MTPAPCATPLTLAALSDYWLGDLPAAEEARREAHLLGCDACTSRLGEVVELARGIRAAARHGKVRVVVSAAFLDRLAGEGLRVRQYRVAPGGRVECTVTAADDLVVGRLAASLAGVTRVDLSFCDGEGRERERLRDIPVNAAAGEVVVVPPIEAVRALPAIVERLRLIAVEAGGERLLGEYTFIHTPSR